jgi:adenylate cyclase
MTARAHRRLAAILALDIAGYSRLVAEDEAGTLRRWRGLRNDLLTPVTADHAGRIVKLTGDGALVEFGSVVDALECAVAIQRAMAEREADLPEDRRIAFRVGINLGDIIIEEDDIYGDGVNIAARIEGLARPGGICVSGSVRDQVGDRVFVSYADLGEQTLKNIAQPVRVFDVLLEASGPSLLGVQPALPNEPSIAVLPFSLAGGGAEEQFLADGLAEDLVAGLSTLKWLFVIARSSTESFREGGRDTRQIGRDLGVRYLLDGSIRSAGDRLRITSQLVEAETGRRLWAERYDRRLTDVFAIQDEITESVIGCLQPELLSAELGRVARKPPQSLDAWECNLRGIFLYSEHSQDSTRAALEILDRAIALDPGYAQAMAVRAVCVVWRAFQGWDDIAMAIPEARALAERAANANVNEPWVYIAHAFVFAALRADADAIRAASRAVTLSPNFAYAHGLLGALHACGGRPDEAIRHIDQGLRLSPRDTFIDEFQLYYSFAHFQARRYAEAAAAASAAMELRPGHAVIHMMATSAFAHAGQIEMAAASLQRLLALVPDLTAGVLHAAFPFYAEADRIHVADGLRMAGLPA